MNRHPKLNRRTLLGAAATGAGAVLGGLPLPHFTQRALAQGAGKEYVFLSIVTQAPFWVDHRMALKDAEKALGVTTSFTGNGASCAHGELLLCLQRVRSPARNERSLSFRYFSPPLPASLGHEGRLGSVWETRALD
jgi:hypothetical protein